MRARILWEGGWGSIQLLSSHLRSKRGWYPLKCKHKETGGGHDNSNICIKLFSIKYQFHKLLAIVTRFFVSFIKILVLLKLYVARK